MNKRGQFFLIAAMLIVGVIIGLASVVNSSTDVVNNDAFFSRTNEIKQEGNHVLDYGTYYQQDTLSLTTQFVELYANLIAQDRVIFIFGNLEDLHAIRFNSTTIGTVGISTGGVPNFIEIGGIISTVAIVTENDGIVSVEINDFSYEFKLKPGENFYFVIQKDQNDQTLVTAG